MFFLLLNASFLISHKGIKGQMNTKAKCSNPECSAFDIKKSVAVGQMLGYAVDKHIRQTRFKESIAPQQADNKAYAKALGQQEDPHRAVAAFKNTVGTFVGTLSKTPAGFSSIR
jgi:hypothetical protein